MTRTIDEWARILGAQDATNRSDAEAAAHCILQNLLGYRKASTFRREDAKALANALQGYAKLLQMHGVKI